MSLIIEPRSGFGLQPDVAEGYVGLRRLMTMQP